jgi:hypothetical protein
MSCGSEVNVIIKIINKDYFSIGPTGNIKVYREECAQGQYNGYATSDTYIKVLTVCRNMTLALTMTWTFWL